MAELLENDGALAETLSRDDLLRQVLATVGQALVLVDSEGAIVHSTAEAEELFGVEIRGFSLGRWEGLHCSHPDGETPFPADRLPLARALRGEETRNEVLCLRSERFPAGKWISCTAKPIRGASGEIRGALALIRDRTHSRKVLRQVSTFLEAGGANSFSPAEDFGSFIPYVQELLRHHQMIARAVEHTEDSVLITDRLGVIRYVNPGFSRTTGYSADDVQGHTPRLLKSGRHEPTFYRQLWGRLLAGEPYQGLIVNRKKSGELYTSQQTISPIRDENGEITHFVAVLRDVTDLLRNQEREFHMGLAREIQERFYGAAVDIPGFDIAGTTVQAHELGGDYYDFFPMAGGQLGIAVGDVTGHGAGPALVMAETRAYLRAMASQEEDLGVILTRTNRALAADLPTNRFVTLLLLKLDPASRTLEYASAGHVPGFLVGPGGEVSRKLTSLDPPLGILDERTFSSSQPIHLLGGDVLLLMTDGVLETRNAHEQEFGFGGALEHLGRHRGEPAAKILDSLQRAVRDFEADDALRDDITCVILKVLG